MRLIDADALIKAIVRKEPFSDCARVVIAECMEEVRHSPTIEERKTGRWIYGNDFHWYTASCNKCGYTRKTDIKATKWNEWKFCPNCGSYNGGGDDNRE